MKEEKIEKYRKEVNKKAQDSGQRKKRKPTYEETEEKKTKESRRKWENGHEKQKVEKRQWSVERHQLYIPHSAPYIVCIKPLEVRNDNK